RCGLSCWRLDLREEEKALSSGAPRRAVNAMSEAPREGTRKDSGAAVPATLNAAEFPPLESEAPDRLERVQVALGERAYTVELVEDVAQGVCQALGQLDPPPDRVGLALDENIRRPWGEAVAGALRGAGWRVVEASMRGGEASKTLEAVASFWDAFLAGGLSRRSVVVALGGGVLGDAAGFAA